jgi:PAS domain S-box-containing protein
MHEDLPTVEIENSQPRLQAAIIGGGRGCESILRMVREDSLGRFRMRVQGVADIDPDAIGLRYARQIGVPLVTTDYRDLYGIEGLDLLIELTGDQDLRDEVERSRPRSVTLIDHVGAMLFWQLHSASDKIMAQRAELRARLESERQHIQQIFESIPDEVLVVDTEMVIQDANSSFLHNNSLEIGDVRGRHCYEVDQGIRGECQVAVGNCPFHEVLASKQRSSTVRKHFDEEGNPRVAAIVAGPLKDLDGNVVGVVEMTRDITHRLLLEEELKTTEIQLQQFMEMAPLATYVKNRHGQYIQVNPATCRLLGLSRKELITRTDMEALPPVAAEVMRAGDREVIRTASEVSFDASLEIGGKRVHLSTIKYPVLDANGRAHSVCGLSKDVTAQKEAEAELTRTREYLQAIMDNTLVAIYTTDLDGRIVSFNRGAEESLGYSSEELIGKHVGSLYRFPSDREELIGRVRSEGAVSDHETELLHRDGHTLPVSLTLSQMKDREGRMVGSVGMAKDISHRRVLMDQVVMSERLAAVGRLAAGVAHEINNPLAVIGEVAGYLEDVLEDADTTPPDELLAELREWLPKLSVQVKRGRSVTSRLLHFARKSQADSAEVDVNAALAETIPFVLKEATLAQVEILEDYGDDVAPIFMEEMQLQEIVINLMRNAIQAMRPDGGGTIWLSTATAGGRVVIQVRDDGPGIDAQVRSTLFDPFVTTKPTGQGTGLGLSICYGIVKRYDGEIRVASTPGEGTTFTVTLPAYEAPPTSRVS